jgi:cytochrome c oxidase assembly protein Cox11
VDDAEAGRVPVITLSYTFYETDESKRLAALAPDGASPQGAVEN